MKQLNFQKYVSIKIGGEAPRSAYKNWRPDTSNCLPNFYNFIPLILRFVTVVSEPRSCAMAEGTRQSQLVEAISMLKAETVYLREEQTVQRQMLEEVLQQLSKLARSYNKLAVKIRKERSDEVSASNAKHVEMATEELTEEIGLEDGKSKHANDSKEANGKAVQEEGEDKIGDLTADDQQEATKKKKNKSESMKKKEPPQQNDPPSIPVIELFPSGEFPEGEIQQSADKNLWRTTSGKKRELEQLEKPIYNSVHQAAEVHHQIQKYTKQILKPGWYCISYRMLLELAAAHWSLMSGDKTILQYDDGMKRR